jgi:hypothetical protein
MMSASAEGEDTSMAWTRAAWTSLLDASCGGTYLNFSGDDGKRRVLDSLGAEVGDKQQRLVALKRKYDAGNFFRINHNIDPSV